MDISRNGGDVAFRTAFSPAHDLIQIFRGLSGETAEGNNPVDFRLAGLQRRGCGDIWHVDQVLAFSTDECPPVVINGEDIGGNHGHPCGVRVHAPNHGKDVRDTGSLWQDEAGVRWTLLRVESPDRLLMLSENTGPSPCAYDFASWMTGMLSYVENGLHQQTILVQAQTGRVQLTPAIRHLRREVVCLRNGRWQTVNGDVDGCEQAEIREVYEIINPATVAQALRSGRMEGGYVSQPSLAVGEAMLLHRMTYRIAGDGTVLCDFDHQRLQPVHLAMYLGIMHQERCDVFGGGVRRYIPKVRPFAEDGNTFDFSEPYNVSAGPMPRWKTLTRDCWANSDAPPDRQLDLICRKDGSVGAVFASGFLPVYDGVPERRRASITDAGEIVASRKTYPTFAGGRANLRFPHRESTDGSIDFPSLRGIGYRKYFLPETPDASLCTVADGPSVYIVMDFFAQKERVLRYALNPLNTLTLMEADGVAWRREGDTLVAQGKKGYAVFRADKPGSLLTQERG